jgi:hypothetical protein
MLSTEYRYAEYRYAEYHGSAEKDSQGQTL